MNPGKGGHHSVPKLAPAFDIGAVAGTDPFTSWSTSYASRPVFFAQREQTWVITRYCEASDVLRKPDIFSSRKPPHSGRNNAVGRESGASTLLDEETTRLLARWKPPQTLMGMDPPGHTNVRAAAARAFTARAVQNFAPDLWEIATEFSFRLKSRTSFDLLGDFAKPLAMLTALKILGIPLTDTHRFLTWLDQVCQLPRIASKRLPISMLRDTLANVLEWRDYIDCFVEERDAAPQDDLTSSMLTSKRLSRQQVADQILALNLAGVDPAAHALVNVVDHALGHHDGLSQSVESTEVIEEILRVRPPVVFLRRQTTQNTEIGDVAVPAGADLTISLVSANRDATVYKDPEDFRLRATEAAPLTFGRGPHYCVGASLARLQIQVAAQLLSRVFPRLRQSTAKPTPHYVQEFSLVGFKEYHVEV